MSQPGGEPGAGPAATSRIQRVARPAAGSPEQGLPEHLRTGVEALSGVPMDGVNVHYDSQRPAQFGALAYTQGTDIHVGPGHEQHLPHEAWHVVQQAEGRVRPSIQAKGWKAVNDDRGLEREADVMGDRAARHGLRAGPTVGLDATSPRQAAASPIQLKAPAGWKDDDVTTWEPDVHGGFDYELVTDAFTTLDLDANRKIADRWAGKALTSGLVGLGPVRSTYKSS
jgi:hypothetical protein